MRARQEKMVVIFGVLQIQTVTFAFLEKEIPIPRNVFRS